MSFKLTAGQRKSAGFLKRRSTGSVLRLMEFINDQRSFFTVVTFERNATKPNAYLHV